MFPSLPKYSESLASDPLLRERSVSHLNGTKKSCDKTGPLCDIRSAIGEQRLAAEETLELLEETPSESYNELAELCQPCEQISNRILGLSGATGVEESTDRNGLSNGEIAD